MAQKVDFVLMLHTLCYIPNSKQYSYINTIHNILFGMEVTQLRRFDLLITMIVACLVYSHV